jgi:hypothetical protein
VARFQPRLVVDTLNRHGVRYVLIGGVAATLHGSPLARFDLDGVVAPAAALLDIIRSKTAANRPKDQASLPVLAELARQLGLLT